MRLHLTILACLLLAPPAWAEWHCEIERSFACDSAGACTPETGASRVILRDDDLYYRRCRAECAQTTVSLRRSFFGSTYQDVKGDLPGLTVLRSRSGEYSEHTIGPDGALKNFAFGTCAWR
jgi:hypothetical protein